MRKKIFFTLSLLGSILIGSKSLFKTVKKKPNTVKVESDLQKRLHTEGVYEEVIMMADGDGSCGGFTYTR
jgi:hypothetical protein